MSLPEVFEVMRRIDRCKRLPNKMYMRAEFEFCARGIEVAGELTSTDKSRHTKPYGPTGKDFFLTEIDPPDIPANEMLKIILLFNELSEEEEGEFERRLFTQGVTITRTNLNKKVTGEQTNV